MFHNWFHGRAVVGKTEDVSGFQKLTGIFFGEKLLFGHEEVIDAIHFAWT